MFAESISAETLQTPDAISQVYEQAVVHTNRPSKKKKKMRPLSKHPIHVAEDVLLINDNCFNAVEHLPDASVRLIVIDPPYNMLVPSKSNRYQTRWKDKKWKRTEWQRLLPHLWRILQYGGRILVFGKKRFFLEVCGMIDNEKVFGFDDLTWVHTSNDNRYAQHQEISHSERIGVFYRKNESGEMKLAARTEHSDVLRFPKDKSFKSMKPPALKQYLIERYSNHGDTVMDICMHTNVSGYAAVHARRRFIGIEVVPELFDESVTNIRKAFETSKRRQLRVRLRVRKTESTPAGGIDKDTYRALVEKQYMSSV